METENKGSQPGLDSEAQQAAEAESATAGAAEEPTPAQVLSSGESLPDHPFDGVVRDHSVAWQHVSAAYIITFALLFGYIAVVTFLLRKHTRKKGPRQ